MSADPISKREFDLYMKMNSETNKTTSKAILAIQKQGQETLDVLKEYTIHNNHKHDETNKRIIDLATKQEKLSEAVAANSRVTSFAKKIEKGVLVVVLSALAVIGSYYGNKLVTPQHQEAKKVSVE